jgi:hypothetical protein
LALLAGQLRQVEKPPNLAARTDPVEVVPRPATQRRPLLVVAAPATPAVPVMAAAPPPPPPAPEPDADLPPAQVDPTPKRGSLDGRPARPLSPLGIRVSATIGFEPLPLVYSAECPSDWHRTAAFAWTLDGEDIGRALNGQRTITQPGDHTLAVHVVTKEGAEHYATRQIRVLRSAETSTAPPRSGQATRPLD